MSSSPSPRPGGDLRIVELAGAAIDDARRILLAAGVERFYPSFGGWFRDRVVPGIAAGERFCLGALLNGRIVGVAIGKASHDERKLCTLWVEEAARKSGVAESLAQAAFERLGTTTPIFTVPEERLPEFQGILRRWGFRASEIRENAYRPASREHVFNG